MSRLQRPVALVSTLPAFFFRGGTTSRNVGAALHRRRLPQAPVLHPSSFRAAALSTLPSSSARATAATSINPPSITTTASRCAPEKARGRHLFEIAGYSLTKGIGAGKFIQSTTFSVGGYDWCIQYYPDGEEKENDKTYISVYLALVSEGTAGVRALCDLRLVDQQESDQSSPVACSWSGTKWPRLFSGAGSTWGFGRFKLRSDLERSVFLQDDRLVIQCDISVVMGMAVVSSRSEPVL
ncbi:unnamed protein product [Urochloa decumbens]|uniref:MATH domain-containing protein n=1 Tax=Urochloa decumbens TaxID=240449 RepID=A0ABC9BSL7_9POAL